MECYACREDRAAVDRYRQVMEFDSSRPKWVQIAECIRGRVESGQYKAGHQITLAMIESEFGVARATAQKVTSALSRAGLVRTELGMGSFVTDQGRDGSAS